MNEAFKLYFFQKKRKKTKKRVDKRGNRCYTNKVARREKPQQTGVLKIKEIILKKVLTKSAEYGKIFRHSQKRAPKNET